MLTNQRYIGFGGKRASASLPTATYNAVANWSGSKYLSRTPGSSGSQRIATASMWLKRTSGSGATQYIMPTELSGSGDVFWPMLKSTNVFSALLSGGGAYVSGTTTYTSTSVWYHVVWAIDTTQATDTNRVKIYVNGVEETYSETGYPALNTDMKMNTASYTLRLGTYASSAFVGKIAHVHWIDGAMLTPSSFSQAGVGGTVPKAYTGSFGTNGFLLDFANSSDIGNDVSGLGNDLTVTGLVSGDVSSETVSY